MDMIQYTEDLSSLIKASLAPAEGLSVKLDEKGKTAVVRAPEDQLSLAIGKDGQNARLAAKLTGYRIEIKPDSVSKKEKKEDRAEKITEPEAEIKELEKERAVDSDNGKPTKSKKVSLKKDTKAKSKSELKSGNI